MDFTEFFKTVEVMNYVSRMIKKGQDCKCEGEGK
jgi:hypothetical protein